MIMVGRSKRERKWETTVELTSSLLVPFSGSTSVSATKQSHRIASSTG
jgi:hypothetical protein